MALEVVRADELGSIAIRFPTWLGHRGLLDAGVQSRSLLLDAISLIRLLEDILSLVHLRCLCRARCHRTHQVLVSHVW